MTPYHGHVIFDLDHFAYFVSGEEQVVEMEALEA